MEILDNIIRLLIAVALIIVSGMYFRLRVRFKEVDSERRKFMYEHQAVTVHMGTMRTKLQALEYSLETESEAHKKTREDFTNEYRKDAMDALIHLAENAQKDEIKLDAATQVIRIVSPVTFTVNERLRP